MTSETLDFWMSPYDSSVNYSMLTETEGTASDAYNALASYIKNLIDQGIIEAGYGQPVYSDDTVEVIASSVAFNFLAWFDDRRINQDVEGTDYERRKAVTHSPYLPTLVWRASSISSTAVMGCIVKLISLYTGAPTKGAQLYNVRV